MKTKTCPVVEWYKFHACDITTCKNYTSETQHHCIELDRKRPIGAKQFSDAELNFYKFKKRGVSTRLVQIYRKEAIDRVKHIVILQKFIEYLIENRKAEGSFTNSLVLRAEKRYPLRIKRLGWKNWMWQHLIVDQTFETFKTNAGGECVGVSVHQLLSITEEDYKLLQNEGTKDERKKHNGIAGRAIKLFERVGDEYNRISRTIKGRGKHNNNGGERSRKRGANANNLHTNRPNNTGNKKRIAVQSRVS